MNIKNTYIAVIALFVAVGAQAQQMPLGSHYYVNMFSMNPAFSSADENAEIFLSHRSQFVGQAGSPTTNYLSMRSMAGEKVGLGIMAMSDVTHIYARTSAMANYSYKVKLSEYQNLSFGVSAGVQSMQLDLNKDQIVNEADPLLTSSRQTKVGFNGDFGVRYAWNKLEVGVAIPQLFNTNLKYTLVNNKELIYDNLSHFRTSVRYTFDVLSDRNIIAYPMLMVRAVKGAPIQWDLNGVIDMKNVAWFGMTYHSNSSFALSAGVRYRNLAFGYAHDFNLGMVRSYAKNSSEFLLSYRFGNQDKTNVPNLQMEERIAELEAEAERSRELEQELTEMKEREEKARREKEELEEKLAKKEEERKEQEAANPINFDKVSDFSNEANTEPEKGFYIVVGAFSSVENAEKWKKTISQKGYDKAFIVTNKVKELHQVCVYYSTDLEIAKSELEKIRNNGATGWVLKLQ